jgi:hypothetical protein
MNSIGREKGEKREWQYPIKENIKEERGLQSCRRLRQRAYRGRRFVWFDA